LEGAVQESIGGISSIQAIYQNDVPVKIAENVLIGAAEATEDPGKIDEAALTGGIMRRGESVRSAAERTVSAAAAKTAATSRFVKIIRQDSPASGRLTGFT
jgi:hypothetical protein